MMWLIRPVLAADVPDSLVPVGACQWCRQKHGTALNYLHWWRLWFWEIHIRSAIRQLEHYAWRFCHRHRLMTEREALAWYDRLTRPAPIGTRTRP